MNLPPVLSDQTWNDLPPALPIGIIEALSKCPTDHLITLQMVLAYAFKSGHLAEFLYKTDVEHWADAVQAALDSKNEESKLPLYDEEIDL